MEKTATLTASQSVITGEAKRNKARRKAVRLNDRILVWAVDLFTRKTQAEYRKENYGHDPLV